MVDIKLQITSAWAVKATYACQIQLGLIHFKGPTKG